MDRQRLDDPLEPIYNSSVSIQDVAWKTSRKQWTVEIGGERGSGISMQTARHDDDDDDDDDDDIDIYHMMMTIIIKVCLGQSVGAAECTDCTTAEG